MDMRDEFLRSDMNRGFEASHRRIADVEASVHEVRLFISTLRGIGSVIPLAIFLFCMFTFFLAALVISHIKQGAPQGTQTTHEQAQSGNEPLPDLEKSDDPSSAVSR